MLFISVILANVGSLRVSPDCSHQCAFLGFSDIRTVFCHSSEAGEFVFSQAGQDMCQDSIVAISASLISRSSLIRKIHHPQACNCMGRCTPPDPTKVDACQCKVCMAEKMIECIADACLRCNRMAVSNSESLESYLFMRSAILSNHSFAVRAHLAQNPTSALYDC